MLNQRAEMAKKLEGAVSQADEEQELNATRPEVARMEQRLNASASQRDLQAPGALPHLNPSAS